MCSCYVNIRRCFYHVEACMLGRRLTRQAIATKVECDRSMAIDAAVVRIMKARRVLGHTALIAEVRQVQGVVVTRAGGRAAAESVPATACPCQAPHRQSDRAGLPHAGRRPVGHIHVYRAPFRC